MLRRLLRWLGFGGRVTVETTIVSTVATDREREQLERRVSNVEHRLAALDVEIAVQARQERERKRHAAH